MEIVLVLIEMSDSTSRHSSQIYNFEENEKLINNRRWIKFDKSKYEPVIVIILTIIVLVVFK